MLKKSYARTGTTCKVTFQLPAEVNAEQVTLCGSFNDWDQATLPLKKQKDGCFKVTLTLESGQAYQFRYLLDGDRWENDWAADRYVSNPFGSEDSVVDLTSPSAE